MNDFVAKPIDPEELISRLSLWIGKRDRVVAVSQAEIKVSPATSVPNLDDLANFDFTGLRRMVGDDEKFILQLLHVMYEDTQTALVDIDAKIQAQDLDAARKLVHAIKGAAGNLGATKLHNSAVSLEAILKQSRLEDEVYANFKLALTETREALSQL